MPVSEGLVNGEEVVVSIRPEKIRIAEKSAKNQSIFAASVTQDRLYWCGYACIRGCEWRRS